MRLYSSAFEHNGDIPVEYTCEGSDISPPLEWSGVPAGTESLALIVDDPDAPDPAAPKTVWVHWVVFNLPKLTTGLPQAIRDLPKQARCGLNDWKRAAYGGPCPPRGHGIHHYHFRLLAISRPTLDLRAPAAALDVLRTAQPYVIEQAEFVSTYHR